MTHTVVIFDLDGTLLDSLTDIANAANEVLAESGLPVHAVDAYRFMVGDGVAMLFERALPEVRRETALVERCVEAFRKTYEHHWNQRSRPYEGIPEMLDALVRSGRKLAVLSNKPQEFTERCVREYFSPWPIAPVYGQRAGVPRKPDPAAALQIAAQLGAAPAECLYLGDSLVDMQTACRAGMFAVGALWGFRPRSELEAHGAAAVVAHPREVLELV
jgi:phosphoglycolate phosphatase